MEKFQGMAEARLNSLEDKTKEHSKRLTKLEDKQEDVIEMKTLLNMAIQDSKKRDEMFKEHSETLKGINANLTQLTHTISNLDSRVINLEDSVSKIDDNSKINWHEIVKKILIMGAVSVGTLIASYLYKGM